MSEQIEQLKSDKAALEAAQIVLRKHGSDSSLIVEDAAVLIQEKINRLEKQAADPWQDAKEYLIAMELPLSASYWQNVVAKYVRHLEEIEKELAERPVVWCLQDENGKNYHFGPRIIIVSPDI